MSLQFFSAATGNTPLRHCENPPGLYAYRGLPALASLSLAGSEGDFSNSQMVTLGAAWASGGWYIYSDLIYSNGNYFVGNEGDDYSNILDGVGDFGITGNDKWNYRFNLNFGYYF